MANIPIEKQLEFISQFEEKQPIYKLYSSVIEQILNAARERFCPTGFVSCRAKTISSFSEKIIRKDKYLNPLEDMTDLCGGRIIVHFSGQVQSVCRFIEEHFTIDYGNSVDTKNRLQTGEFGYRSYHFIVSLDAPEVCGIAVPQEIRGLKAEIQVRTLNEHTWADILHDRIYKTSIRVPLPWQRETARLSALLEELDSSFQKLSEMLDGYTVNYLPTPPVSKVREEILLLETILGIGKSLDERHIGKALRLASLYSTLGEWQKIIDLLGPLAKQFHRQSSPILGGRLNYELGFALCMAQRDQGYNNIVQEGLALMGDSLALLRDSGSSPRDCGAASHGLSQVCLFFNLPRQEYLQRNDSALQYCPENPYYKMSSLVQSFQHCESASVFLDLVEPQLPQLLQDFQDHAELGIESVRASLFTGICHFILGDMDRAILGYLDLMEMVIHEKAVCSPEVLEEGILYLESLKALNPGGKSILSGMLSLLELRFFKSPRALKALEPLARSSVKPLDQILLVAGISRPLDEQENTYYGSFIEEALMDFQGDVISGGTDSGICGLLGAHAKQNKEGRSYRLRGYLPAVLPKGVEKDLRYDELIETPAENFSFLEPLCYWTDLMLADKPPTDIKLLGLKGSLISEMEYKLALLMGASVMLINNSGGAVDKITHDESWNCFTKLLVVPRDPKTVWALMNQNRSCSIPADLVLSLARKAHLKYRAKQLENFDPASEDINAYKTIVEWDQLEPGLKESNVNQIRFIEHLLARVGLRIRESSDPRPFHMARELESREEKDFETLAQLEHARWNAHRLLAGWKYGSIKDISKKKSPYIVRWNQLSEEMKSYDYQQVENWAAILNEAGYEIVAHREDK